MWSVVLLRSRNPDWFMFKMLLYSKYQFHCNRRTIIFSISLQALLVIEMGR